MKKIAILIPVKDNLEGLQNTISSIELEDGVNIKIFVCDDGSSVPVEVGKLVSKHPIFLITNDINKGVSFSKNRLLNMVSDDGYDYISFIDAGDLSTPNRLTPQILYLEVNKEVLVLGAGMKIVGLNGEDMGFYNPPVGKKALHRAFRCGYPVANPTVMFRASALKQHALYFKDMYGSSEDYGLYYQLHLMNPLYVSNIPNITTIYVRESNSIGVRRMRSQALDAYKIRLQNFNPLSIWSILGIFDPRLIGRMISPTYWTSFSSKAKDVQKILKR